MTKIMIVGAGLVGLSFALSMKQCACTIELLETYLPDILANPKADTRPISLSYGSYLILQSLGVWNELETVACPILSVHVSEQGQFGFTQFTAKEQKVSALGFVVPIAYLQSALHKQVALQNNIALTAIKSINNIIIDHQGAAIQTDSVTLHADLLIAADGTYSRCRQLLNISTDEKDRGDTAHIYQIILSEEHNNTAYERFTEFGVLAVLPLFEKKRAQLVWTITPRIEKKIMDWDITRTLHFLQETFDGRLSIANITKSEKFPLKTVIAKNQVKMNAILLGNSAHTIYPVAAQGFNLGLRDAAILSETVQTALHHQQNIGDLTILKKYEASVLKHQETIYRLTGQLMHLFELPWIGCARGISLLAMELFNPIKNKLAKRAMGCR